MGQGYLAQKIIVLAPERWRNLVQIIRSQLFSEMEVNLQNN